MRALLFFILTFATITSAYAQSKLSLINGEAPYAGVKIRLEKGYKTYYRTPGESGLPPLFDFKASQNLRDVTVLWPTPQPFGQGVGAFWGYQDEVILPLKITPEDEKLPVILSLTLEYGVCKEVCVPQKTTQTLKVTPQINNELTQTLASLPQTEQGALGLLAQTEKTLTLRLPNPQITAILVENEAMQTLESAVILQNSFRFTKSTTPLTLTFLREGKGLTTQLQFKGTQND
jgi:hypothetical protein